MILLVPLTTCLPPHFLNPLGCKTCGGEEQTRIRLQKASSWWSNGRTCYTTIHRVIAISPKWMVVRTPCITDMCLGRGSPPPFEGGMRTTCKWRHPTTWITPSKIHSQKLDPSHLLYCWVVREADTRCRWRLQQRLLLSTSGWVLWSGYNLWVGPPPLIWHSSFRVRHPGYEIHLDVREYAFG